MPAIYFRTPSSKNTIVVTLTWRHQSLPLHPSRLHPRLLNYLSGSPFQKIRPHTHSAKSPEYWRLCLTLPHVRSSATLSISATAHALPRIAKRNTSKRFKNQVRRGVKDESINPLKERRKIHSSTSIKYARPRMIKVEFVVTALTIARLANIGVSRPVDHSVPSLVELQKLHPEFTVVSESN